jgi:tetratricopeptide (TPR) repeat protein
MTAATRPETTSIRVAFGRLTLGQRLAALLLLALLVRAVYLAQIRSSPFFGTLLGDAASYDAWGMRIQSDWVGGEIFYQAPLYPYWLALFYRVGGHHTLIVRVAQIGLGAGAAALLALAGRSFVSRRAAWIAGLLLAFYAPALFFEGLVQKPSLDLFLVCALLFFLGRLENGAHRMRTAFAAGVTLGCLSLTRENAVILLPALAIWLAWLARGAAARLVAGLLLGSTLVLAPVALRNYAVGRELVLTSTQFGANFFIGNNEAADGLYEPLVWGHGSYPEEHQDAIDLATQAAGRPLAAREVSAYWAGLAWQWIRAHPVDWLKLMGKKALLVFNAHEVADSDEPVVYEDASWVLRGLSAVCTFGVVCPLAAVGAVATWRDRRRLAVLYLVAGGIACSAALFFVFARYRFPMVPVILLFAGAGIDEIAGLVRERRRRELGIAAGVLVATSAVVWLPLLHGADGRPRATAYYNLAVSLEQAGDEAAALTSYRSAIADQPDLVQARVNLGSLLARSGDLAAAIEEERSALAVRPDDAVAHTILANALFGIGHLDEAEVHYRAALRVEPSFASAREGLFAVGTARRRRDDGK